MVVAPSAPTAAVPTRRALGLGARWLGPAARWRPVTSTSRRLRRPPGGAPQPPRTRRSSAGSGPALVAWRPRGGRGRFGVRPGRFALFVMPGDELAGKCSDDGPGSVQGAGRVRWAKPRRRQQHGRPELALGGRPPRCCRYAGPGRWICDGRLASLPALPVQCRGSSVRTREAGDGDAIRPTGHGIEPHSAAQPDCVVVEGFAPERGQITTAEDP